MTTKAFSTVVVRLLGLVALFKGAMGIPALLWVLLQVARQMRAGAALAGGRMSVLNLAFSITFPIILGVVCLARTKTITALITKGTEENAMRTEGSDQPHTPPGDGAGMARESV